MEKKGAALAIHRNGREINNSHNKNKFHVSGHVHCIGIVSIFYSGRIVLGRASSQMRTTVIF